MSYIDSEYGLTIPPSPVCMCLRFFPSASKSISILWNCDLFWHCAWLLSGMAVSAFALQVMWALWCKEVELDCYKRRWKQIQGEPTWGSTEASDVNKAILDLPAQINQHLNTADAAPSAIAKWSCRNTQQTLHEFLTQRFIRNKKIIVVMFKPPSLGVVCYPELGNRNKNEYQK